MICVSLLSDETCFPVRKKDRMIGQVVIFVNQDNVEIEAIVLQEFPNSLEVVTPDGTRFMLEATMSASTLN